MRTRIILLFPIVFLISILTKAQDKSPVKFGKVSVEDFETKNLGVDTAEGAVIIADIGSSAFEGNTDGWFSLVYKVQRRVLILNNKGFDLASVEIPLYMSSKNQKEEKLDKLKAYTYNLENGKVIETKLSDDAVFKEKKSKNWVVRKFTMPAVKAGSIIEYSYTIDSDFLFNLQPWTFQGSYPRIWSEYKVEMPSFFEYVSFAQGYRQFDIKDTKTSSQMFRIRVPGNSGWEKDETVNITDDVNQYRWVMKNVPPLKEEKYTSSLDDYVSRIAFQLSAYNFKGQARKPVMGNWFTAAEDLMNDEAFAAGLKMPNNWLDADMRDMMAGAASPLEKAMRIYKYVQENIKNTGRGGIYLTKSPKEVFKSKTGFSQEINMLLVTMLKHEDIETSPVILSTINNGHTNEMYPLMDKFNYVICQATIDGYNYYLDASQPYLGFGKLPGYVYNGHARAINKNIPPLYFSPDTLSESKISSVMLFRDKSKPGSWVGNYSCTYGGIESSAIRRYVMEKGKSGLNKSVESDYTGDYSVKEISFEGMDEKSDPVKLTCSVSYSPSDNPDIIYFNPMVASGFKENPFKSAERMYPVEMPYLTDEVFILKVEIPEGYVVDEMPKSEKVLLNESDGMFEYIFSKTDNEINFRSRLKLDKATFLPEDYEYLRGFYDYIVKKHAEQIVFKKKK
jgi:hypothetical protein